MVVVPNSFCCSDLTMSKKRFVPVTATTAFGTLNTRGSILVGT